MKFLGASKGVARVISPRRLRLPQPETEIFLPHAFENQISFIGSQPRIFLTEEVHDRSWHMVDQARGEVGWLGTVAESGNNFLIDQVFLFSQTVNSLANTMLKADLATVGLEILKRHGRETWNRIRFWGHSHGQLSVLPSLQDEEQMLRFRKSQHPYFIRGIFNQLGRIEFSIFYFAANIRIDDVPWQIQRTISSDLAQEVKAELAAKVRWLEPARRRQRGKRAGLAGAHQGGGNILMEGEFGDDD